MDLRENSTGEPGVRHPWERARAGLIARLVDTQLSPVDPPDHILDLGSGDAYVARRLAERYGSRVRVTCADPGYTPQIVRSLDLLAPEGVTHVNTPQGRYDGVLACDVIEHVADDHAFVADLADRLTPGGWLVVTVPAHQHLFGPHDVALGHFRRYSRAALVDLLTDGGFEVTDSGHFFGSLYGLRRLQRAFRRSRRDDAPESGAEEYLHWNGPGVVSDVLAGVLFAESMGEVRLARLGWEVPGLSCWATARRARR